MLGFNTNCTTRQDIDGNYMLAFTYTIFYFFFCGIVLNIYFIQRLIQWILA